MITTSPAMIRVEANEIDLMPIAQGIDLLLIRTAPSSASTCTDRGRQGDTRDNWPAMRTLISAAKNPVNARHRMLPQRREALIATSELPDSDKANDGDRAADDGHRRYPCRSGRSAARLRGR